MAKYGDSVRTILFEVEKFMKVSLKDVSLRTETVKAKDDILSKIYALREEWHQMNAHPEDQRQLDAEVESAVQSSSPTLTKACSEANLVDSVKAVAAADIKDFTKDGFLVKRSTDDQSRNPMKVLRKVLKSSKYYCILKGNMLYLFDKLTSKKPSSVYDLTDYEVKEVKDETKKDYLLILTRVGFKTFQFSCANADDCLSWFNAFSEDSDLLYYEDTDALKPDLETIEETYDDPDEIKMKKDEEIEEEIYDEGDSHADQCDDDQSAQMSPISLKSKPVPLPPESSEEEEIYDDVGLEPAEETYDDVELEIASKSPQLQTPVEKNPENYYESLHYCIHDTEGMGDELNCCHGDVIQILSKTYCGGDWWVGKHNDRVGIIAKSFLTPVYTAA